MSQFLLPHHLADLQRSGLSDATIQRAGIHSEDNYVKLASLLDRKRYLKKCGPALVFPYADEHGANGYCRIRPDSPRLVGGKPAKYESPRGRNNQLYLPSGVSEILADSTRELLITEGEKKALKSSQEGFPCIGLVGVFGWCDGRRAGLLPAMERIAWRDRPVYIVFDSDIADKPEVQEAESRLAAHLANRGANTRVVRLPQGPPDAEGKPSKVGLDDFLVTHDIGELRKLLDSAEEPKPTDPLSSKVSARTIDPATEGERFLQTSKVDGAIRLRCWRGAFWAYQAGPYRPVQDSEVRAHVVRFLNPVYSFLNGGNVANVLDQLKAQSLVPATVEPPAWIETPTSGQSHSWNPSEILVAKNGLVHLPSFVKAEPFFVPLTPRLFSTAALDYGFDQTAPVPEQWATFLCRLWPDDSESITTLQEWFGYVLTADTKQEKILLMIGPRRSGKGTIARVLRAVVGPANVASPTLAGLATNFGLWTLIGKSLATISDARVSNRSDQAVVVERLLRISGEDALDIDRKNLEPLTCKLPTRLVIISNELPRLGDSSGALASRFIVLRMTESFLGREDTTLTDRLLTELPGILLWAIEGWHRLQQRGRFVQPESSAELRDEMEDLTSPIGQFVRECCILDPACCVPVADIFKAWEEWTKAAGWKEPGTQQSFGQRLRAAVPTLRAVQPRSGGVRHREYQGIGLRGGF